MAMGIPVITNSGVGDVEMVVNKYESGYVVKDFSDHSFQGVIEHIETGNDFNKELIRVGAKEFYSLDTAISRYLKVYRAVLGE
jgi:glycosyltransferase involved in cell wall biosynthesis